MKRTRATTRGGSWEGNRAMAINHLFVLMLENRSFDHMLGYADLQGIDAETGAPTHADGLLRPGSPVDLAVLRGAPLKIYAPFGPAHEFEDVLVQLCGPNARYQPGSYPPITMGGFVENYQQNGAPDPTVVMKCFRPDQIPVLTTLAREFAVCDRWFCSMPGPTWPNRFFVHAATSAGLDDSPSAVSVLQHQTVDGFEFPNGTIFDRLGDNWLVFHGDPFPCVYSFSGMGEHWRNGRFQPQEKFTDIVSALGFSARYIFIEPHYGRVYGDYVGGTSQHPVDDVTRGEQLIKDVYQAIRQSPHWNESALVITYDEHGGFYDHVPPPAAPAPNDGATGTHHQFDFTQLGPRVPAVVVSPLIPKGTIDHRLYDHSSVPATLTKIFNLPPVNGRSHLTNRDAQANTFESLFSLSDPRTDNPVIPDPPDSGFDPDQVDDQGIPTGDIDPNTRGFLYVAFLRQYGVSPNIAARSGIAERFLRISTRSQALNYFREVRQHLGDDSV
jgi:phospholipase C